MKKWLSLGLLISSLFLVMTVQAATVPAKAVPAKAVVAKKASVKPAVKGVKVVEPYVKVGMTKAAYNSVIATVTDFINVNLLDGSQKVSKVTISKKSGSLYFLDIVLPNNQTVKSVFLKGATKAGDYFFPTVLNVAETVAETKKAQVAVKTNSSAEAVAIPVNLVKADKPLVEVFVMSYCPYGTQIEKGLLPVIKTLGAKADIQIKFVSYTMHGAKEQTENLTQYCVNKEQPDKFLPYLDCFLKEADSASCIKTANVDTAKVTACTTATTEQYKLVSTGTDFPIYKDVNLKYGVSGSPTLVINGAQVDSGRSPAALLKTICGAFNTPPAECNAVLDSASPAPGFGVGTTTATAPASCH